MWERAEEGGLGMGFTRCQATLSVSFPFLFVRFVMLGRIRDVCGRCDKERYL